MERKNILRVGKSQLSGKIRLSGAKNSALKMQAASILTDEEIFLTRFPVGLTDTQIHSEMLRSLGKSVGVQADQIRISGVASKEQLDWEGESIRNTLLIWGALLAKNGIAKVPLPGGCRIGERKYDLHQMVLERLGARVWTENNHLCAAAKGRLRGAEIHLPIRSTGATENAILAASLAQGRTVIWNPHVRPEVLDLISLLEKMGADIGVRGNESIVVEGVEKLRGAVHSVIPDNMEALTFLIASVVTEGVIEIEDFPLEHLETPMVFLTASGTNVYVGKNSIISAASVCYPLEISTGSYPGINSDMQPIFAVYASCARGMSKIVDLRFPDRFAYAKELQKMGVDLEVKNNILIIRGGNVLRGTEVYADDLRAGAALLIAGLVADGSTFIHNAQQIHRGYEDFVAKFRSLGADIEWIA